MHGLVLALLIKCSASLGPRLDKSIIAGLVYLCLVLCEVLVALVHAGDEQAGCQISALKNCILASSSN